MTTEQVEAVARAIWADDPPAPWEDLRPWEQAEYRRKARVAIGAYEDARTEARTEARTPISGTKAAGEAGTATHAWARVRAARKQATEREASA